MTGDSHINGDGHMTGDGHITSDALARWTSSLAWAEQQCFASIGRWSTASTVDGVTAALAPVSAHHGWRAEQWRALWPQRRGGIDGAVADAAPPVGADDPLGGLLDEIVAADVALGPSEHEPWSRATSLAALGVVAQVILPRFLVGYRSLVQLANGPADGALRRTAERSLSDTNGDFLAMSGKLTALGLAPGAAETVEWWSARG